MGLEVVTTITSGVIPSHIMVCGYMVWYGTIPPYHRENQLSFQRRWILLLRILLLRIFSQTEFCTRWSLTADYC
jgi:cytochrome c oxidase assembly factor CtaG